MDRAAGSREHCVGVGTDPALERRNRPWSRGRDSLQRRAMDLESKGGGEVQVFVELYYIVGEKTSSEKF